MKFTVDVPDEVFWAVAARAEFYDQKVPDLAADLLISVAASRVPTETDPLLRMWRDGFTDAQIARYLNVTNLTVSTRRRRYGLPANRRAAVEAVSVVRTKQIPPSPGGTERRDAVA